MAWCLDQSGSATVPARTVAGRFLCCRQSLKHLGDISGDFPGCRQCLRWSVDVQSAASKSWIDPLWFCGRAIGAATAPGKQRLVWTCEDRSGAFTELPKPLSIFFSPTSFCKFFPSLFTSSFSFSVSHVGSSPPPRSQEKDSRLLLSFPLEKQKKKCTERKEPKGAHVN